GARRRLRDGFTVRWYPDGSTGLVPDDAPELAEAEWAGLLPPGTLHIGTRVDAEAGRPVLSLEEVVDYLSDEGVPAGSMPAVVVVHRDVDGQAWADRLNREVRVPEAAGDDPLITGRIFTPAPPDMAPGPPRAVRGAVDKLIRDGRLTRVKGLPAAFMVPARNVIPAHSL